MTTTVHFTDDWINPATEKYYSAGLKADVDDALADEAVTAGVALRVTKDLFGVTSINGGPLAGFRNAIINGCFRVWQRGSQNGNVFDEPNGYTADRWRNTRGGQGSPNVRVTRQPGPPGHRYSMNVRRQQGDSSNESLHAMTTLETADAVRCQGKHVTLSFRADSGVDYSPAGSALRIRVRTGKGVDEEFNNFTDSETVIDTTVTLTTSWQTFSVTTTAPVDADITGIGVLFSMEPVGTAGAQDWFGLAGVQLEPGETATPFERRPVATELYACWRYFERWDFGSDNHIFATGFVDTATSARGSVRCRPKRGASGAVTFSSPTGFNVRTAGDTETPSTNINGGSLNFAQGAITNVNITTAGGLTPGEGCQLRGGNGEYIDFDAEL